MLVILLCGLAIVVSLPAVVLGCECLLALLPLGRCRMGSRPPVVVLVPAYNEQSVVRDTIAAIRLQLQPDDRLIVIADNCEDQTANIARQSGALVWERNDSERRAKGYAIRFAIEKLAADPPEMVVIVDADCIPMADCIDRIARAASASNRPVQAAYIMQPPEDAAATSMISAFAVLVKNYIRPLGLQRMGMPCLIAGSGITYPWHVLEQVPHPDNHIAEDMYFCADLALAGYAPQPCMEAVVKSQLPSGTAAAKTQRTRWVHGHLSVMFSQGPRLLAGALRRRSLSLLVLGLELMVPPLSLLLSIFTMGLGIAILIALTTSEWRPMYLLLVGAVGGSVGLLAAWWKHGRSELPTQKLLKIPYYLFSKFPIYWKYLFAPQRAWIRTAREPSFRAANSKVQTPHFDLQQEAMSSEKEIKVG